MSLYRRVWPIAVDVRDFRSRAQAAGKPELGDLCDRALAGNDKAIIQILEKAHHMMGVLPIYRPEEPVDLKKAQEIVRNELPNSSAVTALAVVTALQKAGMFR